MIKTEIPHASSLPLKEVNEGTMEDFRCYVIRKIKDVSSKGFPSLTLRAHNSIIFSSEMFSSISKISYNFGGQVFSEERYVNLLVDELEKKGYQIIRHEPCRVEIKWLTEINESID